jgi:integrase
MASETSPTGDSDTVEDPIGYFLEDQEYHGTSKRTLAAYERVLRRFETFLDERPETASRRECMAWVHSLRGDHASSTVATYASYLHRFYSYMVRVDVFENNPMSLVREEMDESIDTDPARREVSIPEMRRFVAGVGHPLDRALVCTLLKTGMRVGELCNLDLRDCNLDGVAETFGVTPRAAVSGRPASLFVDDGVARGEETNGEVRTASNKRERATVIPVDDELAETLRRYLTVRPDARSPAGPLLVSTGDAWGQRVTPAMCRARLRDHTAAFGWHRAGGGAEENVTPHYFRHFFTTHLRDRTGDRGVVKYLRGDVANDIIDTYTHNWGDRVRKTYEANIYSLL